MPLPVRRTVYMVMVKAQMTSAPIALAISEKRPPVMQRSAHHHRQNGIQFVTEPDVIGVGAVNIRAENQSRSPAAKTAKRYTPTV